MGFFSTVKNKISFKDKSGNTNLMKLIRKEPEYMRYNHGENTYFPLNLKAIPNNNMLNKNLWKKKKGSTMRNVLRAYSNDINQVNAQGDSALHVAIQQQKFTHAMLLLRYHFKTVNVNIQNNLGETPLHLIIRNMRKSGFEISNQYAPLVATLMALGAKTDIADNTGNSPLFLLLHRIVNEYDKFIDVLIEMDRSNKIAMDSNSIQFVNNLLRGGVDSYTPRGRIASLLSKYVAPTPLAQQPVELANPMPSVGGFGKTRSKKQRVTRRSKRM